MCLSWFPLLRWESSNLWYVSNAYNVYCSLHTVYCIQYKLHFTSFKWNFKFSLSIFVKISSNYSQLDLLVCASFIHNEMPSKTCSYSLVRQSPLFHHKNIFKIFVPFRNYWNYGVQRSLFTVHRTPSFVIFVIFVFVLVIINKWSGF